MIAPSGPPEAARRGLSRRGQRVGHRGAADPSSCRASSPRSGVSRPTWTVRDTARGRIFLARTVPSGDGGEIENPARSGARRRGFNRLLPLRTEGRGPTVPRANGLFPSQPGRTRRQERAAYSARSASSRGPAAARPPQRGIAATRGARSRAGAPTCGSSRPAGELTMGAQVALPPPQARHAFLFNGPQLGYSIPELFVEFELHSPGAEHARRDRGRRPGLAIGHNGRSRGASRPGCRTRTTSTPRR